MQTSDLLAALDFKQAQLMNAVERIESIADVEGGTAVFTSSLPSVWELNLVVAAAGADRETIEALMAAAERLQGAAGLSHRKLRLAGPGLSVDELAGIATTSGWNVDRELVMVRRGEPERRAPAHSGVREIAAGELAEAEDRFLESEPYGEDPAVRRQLIAQHERWARAATSARCIGIFDGDELAGWCRLYESGGVVEIDSVGVLREKRRRGLGRALLEGVLPLVPRDRLLFLLADTDDWPKDLYGRLGFDIVGERLGATRS